MDLCDASSIHQHLWHKARGWTSEEYLLRNHDALSSKESPSHLLYVCARSRLMLIVFMHGQMARGVLDYSKYGGAGVQS